LTRVIKAISNKGDLFVYECITQELNGSNMGVHMYIYTDNVCFRLEAREMYTGNVCFRLGTGPGDIADVLQ